MYLSNRGERRDFPYSNIRGQYIRIKHTRIYRFESSTRGYRVDPPPVTGTRSREHKTRCRSPCATVTGTRYPVPRTPYPTPVVVQTRWAISSYVAESAEPRARESLIFNVGVEMSTPRHVIPTTTSHKTRRLQYISL